MRLNKASRETFFSVFKEEILKIPDLPLIDPEKIKARNERNEKEELFQKMLNQKVKTDQQKELEALNRQLQAENKKNKLDGTTNFEEEFATVHNFENRLKENMDIVFGKNIGTEVRIPKKKYITDMMYQVLSNTKIQDSAVKFHSFVAIFTIQTDQLPLYDIKLLQTICIKQGFSIFSYKIIPYEKITKVLFEKECLKNKEEISEHDYESLFMNQEALNLEELISQYATTDNDNAFDNFASKTQATMNTSKILKNASTMYKTTLGKTQQQQPLIDLKGVKNAFVLCIVPKRNDDYFKEFTIMIKDKAKMMRESFALLHCSKNRVEGLTDTQLFFPEHFQVRFMTMISLPSLMYPTIRTEIERRLEDALSMNEIRTVRRLEASISKERLVETIKHLFSHASYLADYLLAGAKLRMLITAKVGNPSFNDYGIPQENFIKVTDQERNYTLYKEFFPEIYKFTRVVFIMRPLVVGSPLDELMINVFRINGFVIIKRIYITLSPDQAAYLARHEKVEPDSEQEYQSLMRDGQVQIILISNYAAVEKANVIVNGSNNESIRANELLNTE